MGAGSGIFEIANQSDDVVNAVAFQSRAAEFTIVRSPQRHRVTEESKSKFKRQIEKVKSVTIADSE